MRRNNVVSRRYPERRSNVRYPDFGGSRPRPDKRPEPGSLTPASVWKLAAMLGASSVVIGVVIGYLIGR